jgi:hypothetical protein
MNTKEAQRRLTHSALLSNVFAHTAALGISSGSRRWWPCNTKRVEEKSTNSCFCGLSLDRQCCDLVSEPNPSSCRWSVGGVLAKTQKKRQGEVTVPAAQAVEFKKAAKTN